MATTRTIIILAAAFLSVSCSGLRQAARTEAQVAICCTADADYTGEGKVNIDIEVSVPEDFRNHNTGIVVVPELVSEDGHERVPLTECIAEGALHNTFNGRKYIYEPGLTDSVAVRKAYMRRGATLLESVTAVRLEDWMKESRISVNVYADAYCRKVLLSSETFPLSVIDPNSFADLEFRERYYYVWEDGTSAGERYFPLADGFLFSLDSYSVDDENIRTSLGEYVSGVLSMDNLSDYSVSVTVSNSPEGSLGYNRDLGRDRLQAAKDLLSDAGIDTAKCSFTVVEENWDGVRKAVSESFSRNRLEILSILDSIADPDERENAIRDRYYSEWRELRKNVYPALRYCRIEIVGDLLPDSFCLAGDDSGPDACGLNISMLEKVKSGDFTGAADAADMIPNSGIPEKILYNKAMVYLKTGREEEAGALLRRCTGIPEARYNLAVLYIMSHNYAGAEPLLEDCDCINRAVVKAALGKDDEARDILVLLPDSAARDGLTDMLEK